jgi:hypothetical protein
MAIDEFIGRRDKRFQSNPPVLRYHHESDGYTRKAPGMRTGRSVSVDSGSDFGHSRVPSGRSFDEQFGTPASFKSVSNSTPRETYDGVQSHVTDRKNHLEVPAGFKSRGDGVDIIEVPINSNPAIPECTGFHGDSQLPFLSLPNCSDVNMGSGSGCEDGEADIHLEDAGAMRNESMKGDFKDTAFYSLSEAPSLDPNTMQHPCSQVDSVSH